MNDLIGKKQKRKIYDEKEDDEINPFKNDNDCIFDKNRLPKNIKIIGNILEYKENIFNNIKKHKFIFLSEKFKIKSNFKEKFKIQLKIINNNNNNYFAYGLCDKKIIIKNKYIINNNNLNKLKSFYFINSFGMAFNSNNLNECTKSMNLPSNFDINNLNNKNNIYYLEYELNQINFYLTNNNNNIIVLKSFSNVIPFEDDGLTFFVMFLNNNNNNNNFKIQINIC